jgi:hypothetical protein
MLVPTSPPPIPAIPAIPAAPTTDASKPAPQAISARPSGRELLRSGLLGAQLIRLARLAAEDHPCADAGPRAATDLAQGSGR